MSLFTASLPHQPIRLFFASAGLVLLSGCITYNAQELSAMPGDRLCEMQLYSRVNLKNETKALLQSELRKRNEDCRQYVAQLERERANERERRMYELNGP